MKVSKELFEAVMELENIKKFESREYGIVYDNEVSYQLIKYSYDTFFFDCKAWALKQGYQLQSAPTMSGGYADEMNFNDNYKEADSEQQAVFTACEKILEWILDETR